MTFEELEREGLIRNIPIDERNVDKSLEVARRDIESAKFMLMNNEDWAYCIAYNAMQQSLRAFMYSRGYRPSSESHHVAAIRFAALFFERELINKIDKIRRRRSTSTYDQVGTITKKDAEAAIATAEKILKSVEEKTKIQ